MVFDISKVTGIGEYAVETESIKKDGQPAKTRTIFRRTDTGKAFLVEGAVTLELRTDPELRKTLTDKYESVMESRYFGRGGIEIVTAGHQLTGSELCDLVRLSYNLSIASI